MTFYIAFENAKKILPSVKPEQMISQMSSGKQISFGETDTLAAHKKMPPQKMSHTESDTNENA